MAGKRSYDDGCAAAHALDLVGERWALLVVRELVLGPRRFTDLRAGLPGISPNVLTQRLEELEQGSVVRRRKLPPPAASWVYELTEWGAQLEGVIKDLGRWAARSPTLPGELPMSVASLVLSLRTMFNAEAAWGFDAVLVLRLGDQSFVARIEDQTLDVRPGTTTAPDAVIEAGTDPLAALLYDAGDVATLTASGAVRIEGDPAVVQRFLTLFPLPAPAPDTATPR